jgi:beta-lactamase class A
MPAFALAVAVFGASLLVGTLVVLRALQPGTPHRAAAMQPADAADTADAGQAEPGATRAATPSADFTQPIIIDVPIRGLVADARLAAAIRDALGAESEHYGVVVKRLSDGRGASLNADREFYAASTFKLAVLLEAERRLSAGTLKLDDRLQLSDEDVTEDLGTLGDLDLAADGSLSIRAALEAMVTVSDNSTAVALLHLFGAGNIDATLAELGLQHTSLNTRDLPTTAGDMALLMEAVVTGKGMSEPARRDARELLLRQEVRDGIPAGLPQGVNVGNKTGTWEGATHDVAFVEGPTGTYVITVLSDKDWDWAPISRVSKAVFDVLAKE